MALSNDLISQFVKITNDGTKTKTESMEYGTVVEEDGAKYVRLDGATDTLTPISSTAEVSDGDRVTVVIKNHSAIITGNLTKPATNTVVVTKVVEAKVEAIEGEFEKLTVDNVTIHKQLDANSASIETLETDNVTVKKSLSAAEGTIADLQTDNVEVKKTLTAATADIETLKTDKLNAEDAKITYATIKNLDATNANIEALNTNKLSVEDAKITYANIDFSNIGSAAMEYFYSVSGLIDNVVVGDGTITGSLVGVTIKGDLIETNTLVADKLVIQGEDGLYYKLNTNGESVSSEQTEYNSLNGSIITAKSITAEKVSINDLVAFDATIGGFNITENSISSEVKDSEGNTTRGIYMDTDGQINFGDESNFIKYYKAEDDTYKLIISAESILYTLNGSQHSIADIGALTEYVKIGTYQNESGEEEPCIELGEGDSDFKLVITNTRIMFMEGTSVPAYVNNRALHIEKATVEDELQFGGFIWKKRSNGNMGLLWKGE